MKILFKYDLFVTLQSVINVLSFTSLQKYSACLPNAKELQNCCEKYEAAGGLKELVWVGSSHPHLAL